MSSQWGWGSQEITSRIGVSLWIFPWIKLSWHSCSVWETDLDDSNDSGNFLVRGYLPLIQKDSSTHLHGLTVQVKEELSFTWDVSLENSADSYLYFWQAIFHSVSYLGTSFSSINHHLLRLCAVFDSISSNIDEVLLINPSAVVFGDFNVHHKDWLTYSGGTDWPSELCYKFSISNDLTLMVDFPDCDSCSFGFIYFFWH